MSSRYQREDDYQLYCVLDNKERRIISCTVLDTKDRMSISCTVF